MGLRDRNQLTPEEAAIGDDLMRALWWKVAGDEVRSANLVIPRVKQDSVMVAAFLLHLTVAALGAYSREVGRPQHHLMAEIWKVPNG